jgi:hypothetical protein
MKCKYTGDRLDKILNEEIRIVNELYENLPPKQLFLRKKIKSMHALKAGSCIINFDIRDIEIIRKKQIKEDTKLMKDLIYETKLFEIKKVLSPLEYARFLLEYKKFKKTGKVLTGQIFGKIEFKITKELEDAFDELAKRVRKK